MSNTQYGRYIIRQELGKGGTSIVYRAYDPQMGREIALKALNGTFLSDPTYRRNFQDEVRIIAQLEHGAIVPVYDYGEHNGRPYIIMRYLQGESLQKKIEKGKLTLGELSTIITRICGALTEAHRNNIIHLDIKPGNILFDKDGLPYLADFGIARQNYAHQGAGHSGTLCYVAPEQIDNRAIDHRADIYQLGVVLFEMLTGRVPFDSSNPADILYAHRSKPIPHIRTIDPQLPNGLQMVIEKAMAKQPEQRYSTVLEFAHAVADAIHRSGVAPTLRVATAHLPPVYSMSKIASTTVHLASFVQQHIKPMGDRQLAYFAAGLVFVLAVATYILAGLLQSRFPLIWYMFASTYFFAAPLAFSVSERPLSLFVVHIPAHVVILSIVYQGMGLLNFGIFFWILISGIVSSLTIWFMLKSIRASPEIWYIATITIAYLISSVILQLSGLESPPYYSISIVGAMIVGYLTHVLVEVAKGLKHIYLRGTQP